MDAGIADNTHGSPIHSYKPAHTLDDDIEIANKFLQYGRFSPPMIYFAALVFLMVDTTPKNILTIIMLAIVAAVVKIGKIIFRKSRINLRPLKQNTPYGCSVTFSKPGKEVTSKGMPSGHTASAVMAALIWGWYAYMTHRQNDLKYMYLGFGFILLLLAAYVSYSRHKVKCHTSMQIFFGVVLSFVIFSMMISVLKFTSLGETYFSDIL